jgi:hypothetical protein
VAGGNNSVEDGAGVVAGVWAIRILKRRGTLIVLFEGIEQLTMMEDKTSVMLARQ